MEIDRYLFGNVHLEEGLIFAVDSSPAQVSARSFTGDTLE